MVTCQLPHYLAYSRAARHGVPTALDAGTTRTGAAARRARAALLARERLLRAAWRRAGGGGDDALSGLSAWDLKAAAKEAGGGAAAADVEAAVFDYFVFKRSAELLLQQRRRRDAIDAAVRRGALLYEDASEMLRADIPRSGPPLDPFFDMDVPGLLEFIDASMLKTEAQLDAYDEWRGEAGAGAAAERRQLKLTLAQFSVAKVVFSVLPAREARRPFALTAAEIREVAAVAKLPPAAVRAGLHSYARLKTGSLLGARELLESSRDGAAAAAAGGGGGDASKASQSWVSRAYGRLFERKAPDHEAVEARFTAAAQAEFEGLARLSLADFEGRLEEMLAEASTAATTVGRARGRSPAASAHDEAEEYAAALRVVQALPPEGRRRLERDPAGGAGDGPEAEAAAAAGETVEFVRSVLEGYAVLRLGAAELLRRGDGDVN